MIQAAGRMYVARQQYRLDLQNLITIQNQWRCREARREFRQLKVGPSVTPGRLFAHTWCAPSEVKAKKSAFVSFYRAPILKHFIVPFAPGAPDN
jgi:hypothetical protein